MAFNVSSTVPSNHLAKMVSDPGFIDLDHLTHQILVTHRLLLHSMKKQLPHSRKRERFGTLTPALQASARSDPKCGGAEAPTQPLVRRN